MDQSVFENMELESFLAETAASESGPATEQTAAGAGDSVNHDRMTEAEAKEKILSGARMFTNCVGMVTKTDASLSEIEYRDLSETLAPGVCKLCNSDESLPPWVKQLLEYAPYMGMVFASFMFGFSVFRKVKDQKAVQAKQARQEKEINPKTDTKTGGADGDKSE